MKDLSHRQQLTLATLSINPNSISLFPSITDRNLSRPTMILPLHLTSPDSSISSLNPRRQLQISESQHQPNARMILYDDLLINGYYTSRLWIGTTLHTKSLLLMFLVLLANTVAGTSIGSCNAWKHPCSFDMTQVVKVSHILQVDMCWNVHSWFCGDRLFTLTTL